MIALNNQLIGTFTLFLFVCLLLFSEHSTASDGHEQFRGHAVPAVPEPAQPRGHQCHYRQEFFIHGHQIPLFGKMLFLFSV
jgi:hypothetical protein